MPEKAVVFVIVCMLFIALFLYMMEYFVPMSAKADMNNECRKALIKMEDQGGLSEAEKSNLQMSLAHKGFTNITITANSNIKQGDELSILVEADYIYNRITGLFKREYVTQRMVYKKYAYARKVVN